ncbi:MAG: hypothetical protein LBQ31_03725 [Bacteroidales bacterium]|jgi:hypothetical protein|nr:hypothetical protein [Bacteroidales bacterium]
MSKVLFLDIDGVLQPTSSRERFEHLKDIDSLYKQLFDTYGVDYSVYPNYDVAAVYYDWDKQSVTELKRILETTGANIVLSSDWRQNPAPNRMLNFFRMHDLDKYFIDCTPKSVSEAKIKEYRNIREERSIEILEYLKEHPEVEKWVAVDDLPLDRDFEKNAVVTNYKLTREHSYKCIEILNS